MARRRKKKAQKRVEPKRPASPVILDTSKLEGEMRSRGVAENGPHAQTMVYYYQVYVNEVLAHSPWMEVNDGDIIEVYEQDEQHGDVKNEWKVGSDDLIVMHRDCSKPRVNSLFGRGGIFKDSI